MPELNCAEIRGCLDEIEVELFKAADGEECQRFHKDTQLTATLFLLFRMASLIRPLLLLRESDDFDGFDAVLRAFEETWYLAMEFRLAARHDRAMSWLVREGDTWRAKFGVLVEFARGRGHSAPIMGRDYGLLSELAHPTRSAAENSVTLCGIRRKIEGAEDTVQMARQGTAERIRYALYRLVWLILDRDPQLIVITASVENMPLSDRFIQTYDRVEPGTQGTLRSAN